MYTMAPVHASSPGERTDLQGPGGALAQTAPPALRPGMERSMARKRPDARDIERALEETVNVMTAARSDVARWAAAPPADGSGSRQRAGILLAEAQAKYEEALAVVRSGFRAPPQRYPRPPVPLHPGTA